VGIGSVQLEDEDHKFIFLPGEEDNIWPGEYVFVKAGSFCIADRLNSIHA